MATRAALVFEAPDIKVAAVRLPWASAVCVAETVKGAGTNGLLGRLASGGYVPMAQLRPLTDRTSDWVAEAEALVVLAEEKGLTLLCDHTFLYHPAVEAMKGLVDDGTIGRPLHFDSVRVNLGLFQPDINVLWDLAPHDISLLSYLIPEAPIRVSATGASHWGKGTASVAYLSIEYPDQFIAHVHVSWLAPVKVRTLMLSGTERMVIYDDTQVVEKVKVYDRGIAETLEDEHRHRVEYRTGDMHAPHIPSHEALAAGVADFVRCIRTGETPRSDGATALEVVRILERAEESLALGGSPVAV